MGRAEWLEGLLAGNPLTWAVTVGTLIAIGVVYLIVHRARRKNEDKSTGNFD